MTKRAADALIVLGSHCELIGTFCNYARAHRPCDDDGRSCREIAARIAREGHTICGRCGGWPEECACDGGAA